MKYSDDDVVMEDVQIPDEYNLEDVFNEITYGSGWVRIPSVFTQKDLEMARERIVNPNIGDENMCTNKDGKQNNYEGLTWGLLSRGKIFTKIATHPVILEVSRKLLGDKCRLSSISSNSVVHGMQGQAPHLDYPYHRDIWSDSWTQDVPPTHLLSITVITLLTNFTPENGSTALIPGSQLNPQFPQDKEQFHKDAVQLTGEAGDVIVIPGSIQHCAMPNKTGQVRVGILQQMIPLFVTPFEAFPEDIAGNDELQKILARDHPHPMVKFSNEQQEQKNKQG